MNILQGVSVIRAISSLLLLLLSVFSTAAFCAPVITSNGGGSTASVSIAENTTAVTTVVATGATPGIPIVYMISGAGADQGAFSLDAATGVLTFKNAPDFEHPSDTDADNNYEVTVRASDGSHTDDQAITVMVTGVNDNTPVITSQGAGSSASVIVEENNTAVTTVKATDADAGTTLIYSIVGGIDQGLFSINGITGALVFRIAPDFEHPSDADGDGNYEVTVRASDGLNHMDQSLTVTVINAIDNPPTITSNGGGSTASISVAENTTAVTHVTATDKDKGTTLAYSLTAGADAASFVINSTSGVLQFKAAPDFEHPTDIGKDNAYEVTVGVSDGTHTVTQAITVMVTGVNDNTPVITSQGAGSSASVVMEENNTAVTTVKATDADAGTTLIYSIVGGIDQGLFSINGITGALVFRIAPDFEHPSDANADDNYEVTVRASDGLNHMDQSLTVTVINANDQPHLGVTVVGGGQVDAGASPAPLSSSITACTASGGSCSAVYPPGAEVSLTATPITGWHFDHWSRDCQGTTASTSVTLNATKSCSANFAIDTFMVTASVAGNGQGSVSPLSQSVAYGASAIFTMTPDAGQHILSASGCGGTLAGSTYTSGPITGACAITVTFAQTISPSVPVPTLDWRSLLALAALLGLIALACMRRRA